jgi:hypothetical protein
VRASIDRLRAALETSAGPIRRPREPRPNGEPPLLDVALVLIEDLTPVLHAARDRDAALCVRDRTESETASAAAARVRRARHRRSY